MQIRIRLFALQRQQTGWRDRLFEVPDGATIAQAWALLVLEHTVLEPATGVVRFARNSVYAAAEEALADGDELAVIPPVAGGAADAGSAGEGSTPAAFRRIELIEGPIDDVLVADLRRSVPGPADGAVVLFVGQTRETPGTPAPGQEEEASRHAGQLVVDLAYEAYVPLALSVLGAIADEVTQRFGVGRMAIVHGVGTVPVGSASVVICVAAPHRGAAFDACRYAIEELKGRAPIWKSERFADGRVWLGTPARHGPAAPREEGR